MQHVPNALLLDFGGVIADTTPRNEWVPELARTVREQVPRMASHRDFSLERLTRDILRGMQCDAEWKQSASRTPAPRELEPLVFWRDFVAAQWPNELRAGLAYCAQELCDVMVKLSEDRTLRTGIREVFAAAAARAVPIAIVSNTLSGSVYRACIAAWGLTVNASIYSVEVGVRKPNPQLISLACEALGTSPQHAWLVGDTYDRDVTCGARAGIGKNILLRSHRTAVTPPQGVPIPDLTLDSAHELAALLTQ